MNLKRRLELHHGVAIVCGLIMGMGIFVTPAGVARGAGSGGLTIILWCLGGLIAVLGNNYDFYLFLNYPKIDVYI